MTKRMPARLLALSTAVTAIVAAGAMGLSAAGAGTSVHTTVPSRARGADQAAIGGRFSVVRAPSFTIGPTANISKKAGAQSETTVAIDPTDPLHLLAAINDLTTPNCCTARLYESVDGGRTWADAGVGAPLNLACYDPWADFNANGDAFFAYECGDQRIAYRKVGETTWTNTVLVPSGPFPDRDMVVTDDTATSPFSGSVYVGYDEASFNNAAHLVYSRDGFGGWVKSPKINDTSATIGVNAAVGPDGTVYATWEDFGGGRLVTDRSTDGGATWATDHTVHTFRLSTASFFIFIPPQNIRGVLPMPFTAVAPAGTAHAGRLYVSYFDKPTDNSAGTDCFVRYSDDGGTTWSGEVKVNDDNIHAYNFHCMISVSRAGVVGVSFYSSRFDATNRKVFPFISLSNNGGASFGPDIRLANQPSDETVPGSDGNQYGDYQGISSGNGGYFFAVWADSRPGALDEDLVGAGIRP
jgi:hypothetical protein